MSSDASDIVPEDFDFTAALYANSTTPDDEQPRCPACGSINISRKCGSTFGNNKRFDGDYRCMNHRCQEHFDEPVWGGGDE